jgi:hypothetical protein
MIWIGTEAWLRCSCCYIDNLSAALKRLTFMPSSSQRERSDALEPIAKENWRRTDLLNLGLLVLVCAVFAWLRWAKLDELLWGDPVHWLHEVSRIAAGERPYRDYSFQYPPFTAFFFGWMFRLFGATFANASILVNFWSFSVVLLCYPLTRFLLPAGLRFPVCFLLACVCATSLTNFNLFSYRIYTPALETGAAGALLSLLGMLRVLRNTGSSGFNLAMIGAGSGIALLSKPEFALAGVFALVLFAFVHRRFWWDLRMLAIGTLPATALYAWLANVVGLRNLMAGISGYGLATFACPWWPTGIGVFGVAAALGEAVLIATILSFPWRRDFHSGFGAPYRWMQMLALPGALIFIAYIVMLNLEPITSARPLAAKVMLILPTVLWTARVLLPVMWTVILLFLYLLGRAFRGKLSQHAAELLLVLAFPVSMSPRTWFGSTQGVTADVGAACYPFLLVLGPYLLWSFLSKASPKIPAMLIVGCLVIAYGAIRLLGGSFLFTDRNYRTLETAAGVVAISDYAPGIDIYRYVVAHTAPSDYVLEIPYGGGLNFASGRPNPIFDTMLFNMQIPPEYQRKDLERIIQRYRGEPRLRVPAAGLGPGPAFVGSGLRVPSGRLYRPQLSPRGKDRRKGDSGAESAVPRIRTSRGSALVRELTWRTHSCAMSL